MNFIIKYSSEYENISNIDDYNVSICSIGNKKINSELIGGEKDILSSDYSAYSVTLQNLINFEYKLTINGEIGDFIIYIITNVDNPTLIYYVIMV